MFCILHWFSHCFIGYFKANRLSQCINSGIFSVYFFKHSCQIIYIYICLYFIWIWEVDEMCFCKMNFFPEKIEIFRVHVFIKKRLYCTDMNKTNSLDRFHSEPRIRNLFPISFVVSEICGRNLFIACTFWKKKKEEFLLIQIRIVWNKCIKVSRVPELLRFTYEGVYPKVSGLAAWSENCKW
jgi:hypothetical protein